MTISKFTKIFLVIAIIIGIIVIAGSVGTVRAATSKLTVTAPTTGVIEIGKTQTVSWKSTNYSAPTVRINLIRKVASNPARYELVRTIAAATKNDGKATWVPSKSDIGTGISLEIGCATSKIACQAGVNTSSSIAVVNSTKYANTASIYQAIEAANNK